MNLIDMFYTEIEDCKARKVPLIIPIGTMEYHAEHASLGCDTMVITGMLERLGKRKEIIVAPPIEATLPKSTNPTRPRKFSMLSSARPRFRLRSATVS